MGEEVMQLSLRSKFIITPLVTGGAVIVLVIGILLPLLETVLMDQLIHQKHAAGASIVQSLEIMIAEQKRLARSLATTFVEFGGMNYRFYAGMALEGEMLERLRAHLTATIQQLGQHYEGIFLLDAEGIAFAGAVQSHASDPFRGKSYKEDHEFQQTIASGDEVFSTVVASPMHNRPTFRILSPIIAPEGTVLGAMALIVNFEPFSQVTAKHRFGLTGYTFLVEQNGKILAHPREDLVLSMDIGNVTELTPLFAAVRERDSTTVRYRFEGVEKVGVVTSLQHMPWSIIITQNLDELRAVFTAIRDKVIFGGTNVLALVVTIATFWANRVMRSIKTAAAEIFSATTDYARNAAHLHHCGEELNQDASLQQHMVEKARGSLHTLGIAARTNTDEALATTATMQHIQQMVERAAQEIEHLDCSISHALASGEAAFTIVNAVDRLAIQANILAINASIEAARTGQTTVGNGFSTIAEAFRELAQRSSTTNRETTEKITDMVERLHGNHHAMEALKGCFHEIVKAVDYTMEAMQRIAEKSEEQIRELALTVHDVEAIFDAARRTSARAAHTATVSRHISQQSRLLEETARALTDLIGLESRSLNTPQILTVLEPPSALSASSPALTTTKEAGDNGTKAIVSQRGKIHARRNNRPSFAAVPTLPPPSARDGTPHPPG